MPGASKLVKVSLLERVPRDDVVVLALRWEATGATGRLFPVLDADLTMTPAGAGHALMRLDRSSPCATGPEGSNMPVSSGLVPATMQSVVM